MATPKRMQEVAQQTATSITAAERVKREGKSAFITRGMERSTGLAPELEGF